MERRNRSDFLYRLNIFAIIQLHKFNIAQVLLKNAIKLVSYEHLHVLKTQHYFQKFEKRAQVHINSRCAHWKVPLLDIGHHYLRNRKNQIKRVTITDQCV